MQPDTVAQANDVVSKIVCSFRVIGVVHVPNPLYLQIQEESLYHSVVLTVGFAAHAADQAMFGK